MTALLTVALGELATLPPHHAMGFYRRPDGSVGDPVTADDVRRHLLRGDVDPETVLRNIALVRWARCADPGGADDAA